MLVQDGLILPLDLPSDCLMASSFPFAFKHQDLVFELVILESECFFGLPKLVQLLAMLVGRLFQKRYLPGQLSLPSQTLSHLFFHLGYFPLGVFSFCLCLPEYSGILLMLLLEGFKVSHQDGVFSDQKVVLFF